MNQQAKIQGHKIVAIKPVLNTKQQAFVHYYLMNGNNATQAAKSAGYSPDTAAQSGSRLLKNVNIREQIDAFNSKLARKSGHTRERYNEILDERLELNPVGNPSHADFRGYMEFGAKLNGLIVDKTEITGEITFEGFKRRMAAAIIDVTPDKDNPE